MTSRTLPKPSPLRPIAQATSITAAATLALWRLSNLLPVSAANSVPPRAEQIAVAIHIVAATIAVPLGGYVLWGRKGDARHKALGRIWAALMIVIAVSSYWLRTINGGFSFIHLFSVLTLVSIPLGIFYARAGRMQDHRYTMRNLYIGLIVAGLFSFAPGRLPFAMLFG